MTLKIGKEAKCLPNSDHLANACDFSQGESEKTIRKISETLYLEFHELGAIHVFFFLPSI
jgi:hypothetical protein